MPEVLANGARINVAVDGHGDGPALMFSNSLGTTLGMWDGQVPAFADHFKIIRYDNRGHGRSSAPAGEYTMEDLARDSIAIMDAIGVESVHWCGLSLGGMVGQWLAANAPERIQTLVLANTGMNFSDPTFWARRIKTVTEKGMVPLVDGTIERWFSPAFRAGALEQVAHARETFLATSAIGYAGCCAAIRDIDLQESNRKIDQPTLVIAGQHDLATPLATVEAVHAHISASRLAVLDAGHLSNVEQPHAFNGLVLRHLEASGASRL